MIRVEPAPEPASFDVQVRQPGLSALAELVGEAPLLRRPGPRRKKVAERREDVPGSLFPDFWTRALDDLLTAYQRICAYLCVEIPRGTGQASVDHMIPKSLTWDQVYEWRNYRLACGLMNSRKGAVQLVLDPFEIEDGWFAIELVGFQVVPGAGLDPKIRGRVEETTRLLKLNDHECRRLRETYAVDYWSRDTSIAHLRRKAPFVARELTRQGRLLVGDQ